MTNDFAGKLRHYFPDLVAPNQHEKLSKYLNLIKKWATAISMIQVQGDWSRLDEHIIDCLHVVPHLAAAKRVIDIGSGAGFPAVVVAICAPHVEITALEPTQKKWAFLRTVKRELNLNNFFPVASRHDDHCQDNYNVAVSRATWNVPTWLSIGKHFVCPGGLVVGMEGAKPTEIPAGAQRLPYRVVDRTRAIILLQI